MEYPVITYAATPDDLVIDKNEVLRYLGYVKSGITGDADALVDTVIKESAGFICPRACYRRFDIELRDGGRILFPYGEITSRHLSLNLKGCKSIYILAATIGTAFDRMMMRTRLASMAKAAVLQAVGAAAVEAFVDKLCGALGEEAQCRGEKLHQRYSPGYGDYGLSHQREIFRVLSPEKYAGITLGDSLLMSPEKSVTAIVGIEMD